MFRFGCTVPHMRIPLASVLLLAAVICGAGIGWRVYKGKAYERKRAEAASLVRARAEEGDAKAQHDLAGMYYYGKGVPQDYAEAVTWYRKAADQGNREAEYGLGLMYREGKGVPQDPAQAINWCRRAAEQGYARAQYALGNVYHDGWQVPQDYDAAAAWYRKAAEQGYADAQYDLGYMYYYGYGVPQDRVEASRLFHQAAAQGNENARQAIGLNKVHAWRASCSHYADSMEEGRKLRRDETKIASRLSVSGQEPSISSDLSGGGRWFLRRSGSRVSIPIACRRTSAAGT